MLFQIIKEISFFKVENISYKIRKFFAKGSSKEIYELFLRSTKSEQWYLKIPMMNCEDGTTNEVVNLNHSKAMNYLTWFICLIPIHPENTTEEEIMIWLPDIIEILLKYSWNNLVVMLIIRLLSEVSTNFKGFNFSRYHETLQYLLSKEILDNKLSASNPSNESAILKHYAQLIVNTYRSINHQRKWPEYKNLEIKSIFAYFEPMMHPEHSFKCPCK